jgi:hydroxyethylthiazole kinase-like uncharacterized protein yjeF
VVVGGSPATPGAALLAGVAALRAGAGKLAIVTAESVAAPLGVAVPEALVAGVPTTAEGGLDPGCLDEIADRAKRAQAVLIGPGLTGPEATAALVAGLLPRLPPDAMVVLDALGLTCGAVTAELLRARNGRVVVTPNDDEMERLLGRRPGDDLSHGELARLAARELGAVVSLRGAVASPDGRAWYGQSGHAGLGTSGSGDVLAGLVTGLAARGAPVEQAAVWGVHLHGEAGERLAARVGRLGFLARELLDEIPGVLTQLEA